jgi:hypothetical protein
MGVSIGGVLIGNEVVRFLPPVTASNSNGSLIYTVYSTIQHLLNTLIPYGGGIEYLHRTIFLNLSFTNFLILFRFLNTRIYCISDYKY